MTWHWRTKINDDENFITVTKASNMALRLRRFVMTKKNVPNHVLDNSKILQEIIDKSVLNWAVLKILPNFCTKLAW